MRGSCTALDVFQGWALAVATVAGAVLGAAGGCPPMAAWSAAIACLSMTFLPGSVRLRWAGAVLAVASVTAAGAATARAAALGPPLARWFAAYADRADAPIAIAGEIVADAAASPGGGVGLMVDVTHVRVGSAATWIPTSGRVRLHVVGQMAEARRGTWTRGRRLEAPVALRWPPFVRNPGSPSEAWQTLTRGFALLATAKSGALVAVDRAGVLTETAASLRRHVRQAADALFSAHPRARAIVVAILIGDRSGLDEEVEQRLLEAGTYHVIAISGGNVAIITMLVTAGLGLLIRGVAPVALVAVAVVATYGWVVGGDPSVTRATVAAAIWLLARAAGVAARPLSLLATVVVVVVVADPLVVLAPGAWLSFGATFGILVFAGPCVRLLLAANPLRWLANREADGAPDLGRRPIPTRMATTFRRHVAVGLAGVVGGTMAVEIVLLPVSILVFERTTLAAPLLNILAIPAMVVVQIAGGLAVALVSVWPDAAWLSASVATFAVTTIVESPRLLSGVPWVSWRAPAPAAWWAVLFYVGAATAALAESRPRLRRTAAGLAAAAFAGLCWSPRPAAAPLEPGWLRVTLIDVGQGESVLIQFPRGRAWLIDAGHATDTFDVGARVVTPALWALGVRRLDVVALSHADLDHAGGLRAIVEDFDPAEIWEGIPVRRDAERTRLATEADRRGLPWREVRRGDRVTLDGVTFEVLHPSMPDWERQRVRNDDSIVCRLRFGDVDVVLTGDIGTATEQLLAGVVQGEDDTRRIRVLKVAHHGSRTSTTGAWLEAVRPQVAMVSVGRNNPFRHPSADVLARLAARQVPLFRTDREGAISVETDGRVVNVSSWTGRRWQAQIGDRPPPA